MKMRKVLSLLLVAALMLSLLSACKGEDAPASTAATTQTTTAPIETTVPVTEPPVILPKLTSITIDGGYSVQFDPEVTEYEVTIPAGRPKVPQIQAVAEAGATVQLAQATISDNEISGAATATVAKDGVENVYTVKFVKNSSAGFQLQYADVYAYAPSYALQAGETFTYQSSDASVVSVDTNGTLTAKKVSAAPVTITATVNGNVVEQLVIDQVIKAPLNIFLIMGQSNAFGWHDVPAGYADYYSFADTQKALSDNPAPGTVWCDDVSNGYDDYFFSGMYDLSAGRSGFSPALGKYWYELTGEKTFMLQTAIGSTPIETWVRDPNLQFFGIDCYAMTVERFNYYKNQFAAADSGFEINRVYGFWLQGETCQEFVYYPDTFTWEYKHNERNYKYIGDWKTPTSPDQLMTAKQYGDYFLAMYDAFTQDVGLQFMGILPTRAMYSVSSKANRDSQQLVDLVAPRAAQFGLSNMGYGNIAIVTLQTEVGRTESYPDANAEGWGYMGVSNIHYNQKGYNALGKDAAENTVAMFSAEVDRTAQSIQILDSDGTTKLEEGSQIIVVAGELHPTAAMVLPLFSDTTTITYEVADPTVCSIDQYGNITATEAAVGKETTITYKCEAAGLSKTISVKVGVKREQQVTYEWNFDNNDLTEKNGMNNLTVSAKTGNLASYTITNGMYNSTNSRTNFAMDVPVKISTEHDWCIEWRGVVSTNSALFGTAGNWTNFMYIAYSVPFEVVNPMRIVGASGEAVMIPYGQYAGLNTSGLNTWKVDYVAATNTVTLYLNDTTVVGSASLPEGWYAEFTNLFGSYFEGVDVDYMGTIDFVRITSFGETIGF